MINRLQGKRTYITSLALMVFAVFGYFTGQLEMARAVEAFGLGAGFFFLRKAV